MQCPYRTQGCRSKTLRERERERENKCQSDIKQMVRAHNEYGGGRVSVGLLLNTLFM